jgi:CHAT domain-containing protein
MAGVPANVRIEIRVEDEGLMSATRLPAEETLLERQLRMDDPDLDVIRVFERWLGLHESPWKPADVSTFGSLLHRFLFGGRGDRLYNAIDQLESDRVRLELIFPAIGEFARLAKIPWEYLYRPKEDSKVGFHLATRSKIVLSRRIPFAAAPARQRQNQTVRVLPVVSRPDDRRLGEVIYQDVLNEIKRTAAELEWTLDEPLFNPTQITLRERLSSDGFPDLVHFMGHGEFDPLAGEGRLALVNDIGKADWVPDCRLAEIMTLEGEAPRGVVLHACDAGKPDYPMSFAGVAPQLVIHGVQNVVAMQYPITNTTATMFSTSLYRSLAKGDDLDVAVQEARKTISENPDDPRVLGLPVVYCQNAGPLFPNGRRDV